MGRWQSTDLHNVYDTVMNQDEVVKYPTEFLNSLDLPGIPPHILILKIGVPIILLRNINPPQLCNGTRLSLKKFEKCHQSHNFEWQIQGGRCTVITYSNGPNRYAI